MNTKTTPLTDSFDGEPGTAIVQMRIKPKHVAHDPGLSHRNLNRLGREWRTSDGRRVRCVGVETVVTETGMSPIVELRQHVVYL